MKILFKNQETLISVPVYEFEIVEDEIILYQNETEKILVMNVTASFIWRFINEHIIDSNMISDLEITRAVMKEYDIRDNFYTQILEDVRHMISSY